MTNPPINFVTDTATLCVFDLAALKHRIGDDSDWWSLPTDELVEVNHGNVAFFGLGSDGRYRVALVEALPLLTAIHVSLSCPSGRIFIGAGEEVTGGDLEPECIRGGFFAEVPPGNYILSAARTGSSITLAFQQSPTLVGNDFLLPLRLNSPHTDESE